MKKWEKGKVERGKKIEIRENPYCLHPLYLRYKNPQNLKETKSFPLASMGEEILAL